MESTKLGQSQELLFKAIANRRRLLILRYLKRRGEKSISDISEVIGLSVKSTSRHLLILHHADLVVEKREGISVYYRINKGLRKLPGLIIDQI